MADRERWRLAAMMALIYAVQGSWWPILSVHLEGLGVSGRATGFIFATFALSSILTPLGAGQIADRRMPTQRLLALIYALGTALLVVLATGSARTAGPIFAILLVYWLLTAPATGLGASLALRNLPRPAEQYGGVRLWGTVGWMVVGWVVSGVMALNGRSRHAPGAYESFWIAAACSVALALYALTLPNTPPLARPSQRGFDLADAVALIRVRPAAIYLLIAFGVSLTTPFVYQAVPLYLKTLGMRKSGLALAMSLGQVLEIVSLALLPRVWNRLGIRGTLALGVSAWVAYYAILAARLPLAISVLAILMNGLAIAFFHVAGQMFLDAEAPRDRRAGAQCLYIVATSGAGTLLGSLLAGEVVGRLRDHLGAVFLIPLGIDLAVLVFLLVVFRPTIRRQEPHGMARATAEPAVPLRRAGSSGDRRAEPPSADAARRGGPSPAARPTATKARQAHRPAQASSAVPSGVVCPCSFFDRGRRRRTGLGSSRGGEGAITWERVSSSDSADCSRWETRRLRKWSRVPWVSRSSLKA